MIILLADDHALFRDGLALVLKGMQEGVEVFEAGGLDGVLELAGRHPAAALALLDLNMPGMHGGRGIERVTAAYPTLPVVVLTASEEREAMQSAMAFGASGYITKSSPSAVVISAIRLVLAGGVYVPPQLLAQAGAAPQASSQGSANLTERQLDVLRLLARGLPTKLICRTLDISEGTAKAHIAAILRALDAANRTEAAAQARKLGLID
jgi:DNA-binding NarL/FixJ family response regulator